MAQGTCVLLVIDVQGGFQVRQKVPGALLIFIQAPAGGVLEAHCGGEGPTTTPRSIADWPTLVASSSWLKGMMFM